MYVYASVNFTMAKGFVVGTVVTSSLKSICENSLGGAICRNYCEKRQSGETNWWGLLCADPDGALSRTDQGGDWASPIPRGPLQPTNVLPTTSHAFFLLVTWRCHLATHH
jgi:hypothetical protein